MRNHSPCRHDPLRALVLLSCALWTLAGCAPRPPRFADRPPVTEVHDDRPIPLPRSRTFIEELYHADVYVRRQLVAAMDPRRYPEALDVSSLDEVPSSSWYRQPIDHKPLSDYRRDGPPKPPFIVSGEPASSGAPDAYAIVDARGLAYELQPDIDGRPGMRSAASAITSRLVHAVGYHTPEVYVIRTHTGERMAATRWPIGVDLGPTPINERRDDDPNDHLPHLERRSLRALKLVTAWLSMKRLRPRVLRDAYLGEPGRGHVRHYLVGLDGALGVDDYLDAVEFAQNPDREDSNFLFKAFSLGLSPKPPSILPKTPWPSVGLFGEVLDPADHDSSPPFEPMDRVRAGDAYWAAKVIAAVPESAISNAIAAGELGSVASRWLQARLHERRATVIAWGYDRTSPCELLSIEANGDERVLVLADLAIASRFLPAQLRSYSVRYTDDQGTELAPSVELAAKGPISRIPLAAGLRGYVVVLVQARRLMLQLSRPLQLHLMSDDSGVRVLGLRH